MNERMRTLIEQEITGDISEADRDELMEQVMMDPEVGQALAADELLVRERMKADSVKTLPRLTLLSNAASFIAGVGLVFFFGQQVQMAGTGSASANAYVLDNVRSATPQVQTLRLVPEEAWVTFMVYPDFAEFEMLESRIDAYSGDPEQSYVAQPGAWNTVWHGVSGAGSRDTLVLTIPSEALSDGIYRLQVFGTASGSVTGGPIHEVIFAVQYEATE